MSVKQLFCKECGIEFEGYRNSKYCLKCKKQKLIENRIRYRQSEKGKKKQKDIHKKYIQSIKGKIAKAKADRIYRNSEKGKLTKWKSNQRQYGTESYRKQKSRWNNSPKGKEYSKIIHKTSKYKEIKRKYSESDRGREISKKSSRKYYSTPKGKIMSLLNVHKRLAKKKQVIHNFTKSEWEDKVKSTQGICPECKKFIGLDKLTVDHITPLSKAPIGFIYTINEVQPLCITCNKKKSNKMPSL